MDEFKNYTKKQTIDFANYYHIRKALEISRATPVPLLLNSSYELYAVRYRQRADAVLNTKEVFLLEYNYIKNRSKILNATIISREKLEILEKAFNVKTGF